MLHCNIYKRKLALAAMRETHAENLTFCYQIFVAIYSNSRFTVATH